MRSLEQFAAVDPKKPREPGNSSAQQEKDILASFSEPQRREIFHKQKVLSSLGYFVGKDFDMPILLNQPGAGWHWNFKENHVKIDPEDLLLHTYNEKRKKNSLSEFTQAEHFDYLRFVISHEGGHRRISRTDFIPEETWKQPGFSFMMNAIEDPRDNNFVAEAYPKFKEQMNLAYTLEQEFDAEAKEIAKKKMGTKPRFLQAGHEYIKQWFNEVQGKPFAIDEKLPREVREVVKKTLDAAQDSWWRYPSKAEADESEALISKYAENSYEINLNKVWPEFKKLVDEDMKDQETRKALEDMQKDASGESSGEGKPQEGSPKNIPENLKSNLTPEQQKELGKALEDPQGKPGTPQPIDMDDLSPELKKKLREYIDSLPEEKKRELAEAAAKIIKEVEDEINKALEGKLVDQAERSQERGAPQPEFTGERETRPEDVEDVRAKLREMLESDKGVYDQVRREVLPVINRLEDDLRELFVERRARKWETGHKFGKKIDLKKRMQEKVKGVSAVDTRAWQKREAPQEKDYAITLLVDLSGSMGRGGKVEETFKAVVVLCEVLNALSIKTEILGFNDRIHEYQDFHTTLKDETRQAMGRMLSEVKSSRAEYNDDGWALKQASTRLARQEAGEKFLIALSDGLPEESSAHSGKEFELGKVVKEIMDQTDQKLIGLGIGRGTKHVEKYYPNNLADVPVAEMAQKLADLLREAIANYQDF